MRTVIISGFTQFGDYRENSSFLAVREIFQKGNPEFKIQSIYFPALVCGNNRGKRLLEIATDLNVSGIISLGMASEKFGLCVEEVAVNRIYHQRYVAADLQNTRVDESRPYQEQLDLDLKPWNLPTFYQSCKAESIPTMPISMYAGGFCCNQLMYQVMVAQLHADQKIPFIFLHIPCCPEAVADLDAFAKAGKKTMEVSQIVHGLELLLQNASI